MGTRPMGTRGNGSAVPPRQRVCAVGKGLPVPWPRRERLEEEQLLDGRYQLQQLPGGRVALPVLEEKLSQMWLCSQPRVPRWLSAPRWVRDSRVCLPCSHPWSCPHFTHLERLGKGQQGVTALFPPLELHISHISWHGCLAGPALWETVASALGARRVARRGRVMAGGLRSPSVTLLLGQDGWVEHVDNGIRYTFDVTKCMFSPGNITEKLRVASLPCSGEVLVDLYAGIGYFTLPFLVHGGAAFVHACEWNSHALEALHRTLLLNRVRDRCHIHAGDNRQLELRDVADRVNLGLIPSSEEGWPVACRVLKKDTGGVLHIHHNVETPPVRAPLLPAEGGSPGAAGSAGEMQHPTEDGGKEELRARLRPEWQRWAEGTAARIQTLLAELHGRPWHTSILHIEAVKSYAPHVHHLVLDLECRPVLPV
uniref:tRNA wybutosine-synthesizing protein 2 homolog n=1 Tax=Malurus cyaneus samueli TaxID=2593467 RepID=A0A8C5TXD4_9PASS